MACAQNRGLMLLSGCYKRVYTDKEKKRFYVLWGYAEGACPRLEWYSSKQHFQKSVETGARRKVLYLEDLQEVRQNSTCAEELVIRPTLDIFPIHIRFDSEKTALMWKEAIESELSASRAGPESPLNLSFQETRLSNRGSVFDVIVAETSQSDKCGISGKQCKLHVQNRGLFLQSPGGPIVNHWPLPTLRKFGSTETVFTIEAGRRAPTGPGVWHFYTDNPHEVVSDVRQCTTAMLQQEDEDSDDYERLGSDEDEDKHDYEPNPIEPHDTHKLTK